MLTLNDGRSELWQWDTGRKLIVDADCSQVHFSNKVFGRSIDVDVVDGVSVIPDILLQTDKDLNVWAFVGTPENGYTKISKVFKVNKRNKPADYVFTPPEQTTLEEIKEKLDYLESIQDPDAIKNAVEDYLEHNPVEAPVQSVNGKTGEIQLTADDVGAISQDDLQEATDKALAQAKESGEFDGEPGEDGISPTVAVENIEGGHRVTITDKDGAKTFDVMDGEDLSAGTLELIETIEVTEDMKIDRSAEADGTPYNFKAVYVTFRTKAAQFSGEYLNCFCGSTRIAEAWIKGITAATTNTSAFMIEPRNGYWTSISTMWSQALHLECGHRTFLRYSTALYPSITRLTTVATMPSGTTIEIWGVRA